MFVCLLCLSASRTRSTCLSLLAQPQLIMECLDFSPCMNVFESQWEETGSKIYYEVTLETDDMIQSPRSKTRLDITDWNIYLKTLHTHSQDAGGQRGNQASPNVEENHLISDLM